VWTNRLLVGGVVVFLAAAIVNGLRSTGHNTPPSKPTALTKSGAPRATNVSVVGLGVRQCAGDAWIAIEIRRPSRRHDAGVFKVHSQHRVATIVLRHVDRSCLGGSAFTFTIRDRVGRIVGQWNGDWSTDFSRRGRSRTFSLPGVRRCDSPGPFTAVAVVGGYRTHRTGLRRSQITC
jgi:hypothetical protein